MKNIVRSAKKKYASTSVQTQWEVAHNTLPSWAISDYGSKAIRLLGLQIWWVISAPKYSHPEWMSPCCLDLAFLAFRRFILFLWLCARFRLRWRPETSGPMAEESWSLWFHPRLRSHLDLPLQVARQRYCKMNSRCSCDTVCIRSLLVISSCQISKSRILSLRRICCSFLLL